MAEIINDWIVRVGFDDTEVLKGTKRIEKAFAKLEKMQARINKGVKQPKGAGGGITGAVGGGRSGLAAQTKEIQRSTVTATVATRQQTRAQKKQNFAATSLTSSLKSMARSYLSVFAAIQIGQRLFKTGAGFENMNATLLLTSGNAQAAAKDFEFLLSLAEKTGARVLDLGNSFAKFGIAGKAAGLTDGQMKKAFTEMAVTIRATGLTQDKANLSFLALQQMLSNGVVSMQELKLQLSEQLPQTMATAEKALRNLGFVSGSVKEIISTGTVESGAFVKELTRLMAEQAEKTGAFEKSANSLTARLGRFNTAIDLMIKGLFEVGGAGAGVGDILGALTTIIKGLTPVIVSFSAGIATVVNGVGLLLTPLTFLLDLIGGSGTGLTVIMSLLTARTLQWGASMLFGSAAMDKLTFSSLMSFLKGLSATAIGTSIATKGFLGWAASIFTAVGALRALKLALGPIGLAFLALEGLGALATLGTPSTPKPASTNRTTTNTLQVDKVEVNVQSGAGATDIGSATREALQDEFFAFIPTG